jgi:hypothetical protein
MANLPTCPQFREGSCARSDLVLAQDVPRFWAFICRTCHLYWVMSKPRAADEARWTNEVQRMAKATAEDRERAARPRHFVAPVGGWRL